MIFRRRPRSDLLAEISLLGQRQDDAWADTESGRAVMETAIARGRAGLPRPDEAGPVAEPRRRAWTRPWVVAVGVGAVIVVTSAAALILPREPDIPTQAGCYSELAADADTIEASADLVAEVGAAEACRQTWASVHDDTVDTRNLVACVNPFGGRGIFPAPPNLSASNACGSMGWSPEE